MSDTTSSLTAETSLTSLSFGDVNENDVDFLHAALPHISLEKLRSSLSHEPGDMWDVISSILSEEWVRELEERGLDDEDIEPPFIPVRNQKKKSSKKPPAAKIVLGDVRQVALRPASQPTSPSSLVDDPWSQINSLSTHLSHLLSPHKEALFSSYFHNPQYPSPYLALRAALSQIRTLPTSRAAEDSQVLLQITLSEILVDVYPESGSLSAEVELAIAATGGKEHETLELVKVLCELDQDSSRGEFGMGVYHSLAPATSTSGMPAVKQTPASYNKPKPNAESSTVHSPTIKQRNGPSPYQWKKVPERKPPKGPHPYVNSIPAYASGNSKKGGKGGGNGFGKGGKGDVGELGKMYPTETMKKRNGYLRQAAEAYRRGNVGVGGGK